LTPLTRSRVDFIRAKLADGWTQKRIADKLGLSRSYIADLIRDYLPELCGEIADPIYREHLLHRWLNVHKIGDIGKRAAEETA